MQQYACNYTESCHDKNKRCVTLSPDVNSPVCKRSLDFVDLCSTVLQYKTKHSRTTKEGRGNVHTEKTCLHPTTDSALRLIILKVVNIFHSSTNGSDRCCTNITNIEINSRCPEVGRQRRPSTTATLGRKRRPPTPVHLRERESATRAAFATRKDTSAPKLKKKTFGQGCGQNHRIFKRHFEKLHEGEN